jgi:osmotically-inducible protein OsmY
MQVSVINLGRSINVSKTQDVHAAVEAELRYDPLLDATDITVKNAGGEVALNGTVPSYRQYLEAAAAARRVAGVKKVHNHLEVLLPDPDYRSDAALTTAANNALAWDIVVPPDVEAGAKDGNVTLVGTVQFGAQRDAAFQAVAGLTGVRNIKNNVDIIVDADPVDVTIRVQDALDRWSLISDDSDVRIDTDHNVVTLAGHVRTWAEHDAVVDAAWMATGVTYVQDDLFITG